MSTIRELVFDWLFNALVQIGLFAILAAVLSPLIAKAKAKYQHYFYLAIFALCLAAPVFNTLWQAGPNGVAKGSQQQLILGTEHPGHNFWAWDGLSKAHEQIILASSLARRRVQPLFLHHRGVGTCIYPERKWMTEDSHDSLRFRRRAADQSARSMIVVLFETRQKKSNPCVGRGAALLGGNYPPLPLGE
jgi:hypothetical protein